jgi:hypothetical protein
MRACVGLMLAACSAAKPAPVVVTNVKPDDCAHRLSEVSAFFQAIVLDHAAGPIQKRAAAVEQEAGISEEALVDVVGPPGDASHSDYLVVAPTRVDLVPVSGAPHEVVVDGEYRGVRAGGTARSLVIAVAPATPWKQVKAVYKNLVSRDPEENYDTITFAYGTEGVFRGREAPHVEGMSSRGVDIPLMGGNLTKEIAAHCPEIAQMTERLSAAPIEVVMDKMAQMIPRCDCAVDAGILESGAWIMRRPVVTLAPLTLGATFPDAQDDTTFADVVRANDFHALRIPPPPPPPPLPPPPPPPPPRRH